MSERPENDTPHPRPLEDHSMMRGIEPRMFDLHARLLCDVVAMKVDFRLADEFLRNTKLAVKKANRQYNSSLFREEFGFAAAAMAPFRRRAAQLSLFLNATNCGHVRSELNQIYRKIVTAAPKQEADWTKLKSEIERAKPDVKAFAQHVAECLDVIKGDRVKLSSLTGPEYYRACPSDDGPTPV